MFISLLVLIFSVNFIRKQIDLEEVPPTLRKILPLLPIPAGLMLAFGSSVFGKFEPTLDLVWFILHAIVVYILWLKRSDKLVNQLFWVNLVFLVANTLKDLATYWTPKFYNKYENYFDYTFFGAAVAVFVFFISYKNQKKAIQKEADKNLLITKQNDELEKLVQARTKEISSQKDELEKTLEKLTATQDLLIQSEKLASLGELTAGIAHEIQNPLNFVNNFAEVSTELITEMAEELANGNLEEVKVISEDLSQNLQKINHHGKRASSIVKGMLEHSRSSTGIAEKTDINALADEYLRLAYHGLRAKDKSFNADFVTHLEPGLPEIKVIPQDMGRVFLNLINNAFYAVSAKSAGIPGGEKYKPLVEVSSFLVNNQIEIHIADNGGGIPKELSEKIFQPFFTTKPTGKGTGLGLSLAYDIVKAHHGDIKAVSPKTDNSGNTLPGTEFIINLPVE